ncbi:MAG: signal peptidase I, partial [Oscillospiraceae bacterium]|nr:signal peptidase I [Oscillospiraceae bacterium]
MGRNGRTEVSLPSMDQIEAERSRVRQVKRRRRVVLRVLYALVIVSAVVVLISSLLFPMLQISGTSMEPTLHKGDIVMMIKTSRYQTGELCTFSWNNKTLIKRVIAVSGDWVEIDESGNVSVNGKKLDEPYLEEKSLGECDIEFPFQV